jgi:eukaryotic-like serine/threonine-protein kinase
MERHAVSGTPTSERPSGLDDLSGTTLDGRFQLLRQLGRGGMGAVYLADDTAGPADLEGAWPRVAVKVIKGGLVDDPAAIKRFEREALTIGRLKHPHIVGYRGTGKVGSVQWLAMEFLDGQSLRERIAQTGPVPWRLSLDIVAQIVDGLAAAHAAGVLHRDLKPDNVMLVGPAQSPTVKLLDFGIAKQTGPEAMTMTGTGLIVGTPGFIAPEVIVGGGTDDPRSDLYAVGVLWFEMVTGARPFDASTPFGLAMKHVQEPAPRPNSVRPFSPVPSPVEDMIVRLLEKTPEKRPASAQALRAIVASLVQVADNPVEPSSSRLGTEPNLETTDATETSVAVAPSAVPAPAPRTSRRLWAAGAVVVGVALLGGVALALWRGSTARTQLTTTTTTAPTTTAPTTTAPTTTAPTTTAPTTTAPTTTAPTTTAPKTPGKKPSTHRPQLLMD